MVAARLARQCVSLLRVLLTDPLKRQSLSKSLRGVEESQQRTDEAARQAGVGGEALGVSCESYSQMSQSL